MNINDYLPHIHKDETIKICNISNNALINIDDSTTLSSIVKLVGIKSKIITFYI